jgi:hypothetical protein
MGGIWIIPGSENYIPFSFSLADMVRQVFGLE